MKMVKYTLKEYQKHCINTDQPDIAQPYDVTL